MILNGSFEFFFLGFCLLWSITGRKNPVQNYFHAWTNVSLCSRKECQERVSNEKRRNESRLAANLIKTRAIVLDLKKSVANFQEPTKDQKIRPFLLNLRTKGVFLFAEITQKMFLQCHHVNLTMKIAFAQSDWRCECNKRKSVVPFDLTSRKIFECFFHWNLLALKVRTSSQKLFVLWAFRKLHLFLFYLFGHNKISMWIAMI